MCQMCMIVRPVPVRDASCALEINTKLLAARVEGGDAAGSASTGYTMLSGDSFSGSISFAGDQDWIRVSLISGQTYSISMTGTPAGGTTPDTVVSVMSAGGTLLASNDDSGNSTNSLLSFAATTTGTHYIAASLFSASETGAYRINFTQSGTTPSKPTATMEELADYQINDAWTFFGDTAHSFATGNLTVNLTGLTSAGRALARAALDSWAMVADLTFSETSSASASIVFDDEEEGAYQTDVYSNGVTSSAFVNVSKVWLADYGTTYDAYSFSTYIHEIGHALGLGHQGPYNGDLSIPADMVFANDSYAYSVMSYVDQAQNPFIPLSSAALVTAMQADIIAIQRLYGAASGGATAGNTVWGHGSTLTNYLGTLFAGISAGTSPVYGGEAVAFTIWDEGGIDTVNFSTDTANQRVDLAPGVLWNVRGLTGTVSIGQGAVIENFVAGLGNDEVSGNWVANTISGGNGNDSLYGRSGADFLSGNVGNDRLFGGDGNDQLAGNAGNDFLSGQLGNDSIWDSTGNDTLYGGDGADRLSAGDGNDLVDGGIGNDSLLGGSGNDSVLGQDGDDRMAGEAGNDVLFGGNGNDTMAGGDGADIFYGNSGHDVMTGGGGADLFVFAYGRDRVTDFQDNIDTLRIDDALWGGAARSVSQLVAGATVGSSGVVFTFGTATLTVAGTTTANVLLDDILIF